MVLFLRVIIGWILSHKGHMTIRCESSPLGSVYPLVAQFLKWDSVLALSAASHEARSSILFRSHKAIHVGGGQMISVLDGVLHVYSTFYSFSSHAHSLRPPQCAIDLPHDVYVHRSAAIAFFSNQDVSHVRRMRFSGVELSEVKAHLLPILQRAELLETLDFSHHEKLCNTIDATGLQCLEQAAPSLASLTTLSFRNCYLRQVYAESFATTVKKLPSLTSLDLHGCHFTAPQIDVIAVSISEVQSLTFLDISFNACSGHFEPVGRLRALTTLLAVSCQLRDADLKLPVTAFPALETLDLSDNTSMGVTLCSHLVSCGNLRRLSLRGCSADCMTELHRLRSVYDLDLSYARFANEGQRAVVFESISGMEQLAVLRLQGTNIGIDEFETQVCHYLKRCGHLREIHVPQRLMQSSARDALGNDVLLVDADAR